jgi:hypothetical protein
MKKSYNNYTNSYQPPPDWWKPLYDESCDKIKDVEEGEVVIPFLIRTINRGRGEDELDYNWLLQFRTIPGAYNWDELRPVQRFANLVFGSSPEKYEHFLNQSSKTIIGLD